MGQAKKTRMHSIPGLHAAAAAESLPSCPTLCDPIEGSPPGSPVPGINSSALSFLYSPTLTSIHDHWKNHSLVLLIFCHIILSFSLLPCPPLLCSSSSPTYSPSLLLLLLVMRREEGASSVLLDKLPAPPQPSHLRCHLL